MDKENEKIPDTFKNKRRIEKDINEIIATKLYTDILIKNIKENSLSIKFKKHTNVGEIDIEVILPNTYPHKPPEIKYNNYVKYKSDNTTWSARKTILSLLDDIDKDELYDFKKSIELHKCAYYHFLDNLINTKDNGNISEHVINFINENIVLNDIICLINMKIERQQIDNLFDLITNNKYCIFQTGFDKHATSLVFYVKDNKLYLFSFNSGKGIHIHEQSSNGLYVPYKGFIISDNFSTDTQVKDKINYIFNIQDLYNKLKDLYKLEEVKCEDIEGIIQILKKLININDDKNDLNDLIIIEDDTRKMSMKDLEDYNKFSNSLTKPKPYYTYYEYLIKILTNLFEQISFNDIITNKSSIFLKTTLNELDKYKNDNMNLDDLVLSKQIFHFHDNNIFIKPQDSGSCTWFSMYWPLLFYHVINDDSNGYINQVNNINNKCYEIIKKVFIPENFKKEYLSENSNFIEMKKLCNKFIDIKLLVSNILTQENDFIYDIDININLHNKTKSRTYNYENDIITNATCNKLLNDNIGTSIFNFKKDNVYQTMFLLFHYYNTSKVMLNDNIIINDFISNLDKIFKEQLTSLGQNFKQNLDTKLINNDIDSILKIYNNNIDFILKIYNNKNKQPNNYIQNIYFIMDFYNSKNIISNISIDLIKNFYNYVINWDLIITIIANVTNLITELDYNVELDDEYVNTKKMFIENLKKAFGNLLVKTFIHNDSSMKNITLLDKPFLNRNYTSPNNIVNSNNMTYSSEFKKNTNLHEITIKKLKRKFEDFDKERVFLYGNPKFLHKHFNNNDYYKNNQDENNQDGNTKLNNYIVDSDIIDFFQLNIFDIWKDHNNEYKKNLISFYLNLWWDNPLKNDDIEDDNKTIVDILSLLFLKTVKNKKLFNKYLIRIKNTSDNNKEFISEVQQENNLNNWYNYELFSLIKKYTKIDSFDDNSVTINEIKYNEITFDNLDKNILSFFNCNNNSIYLINETNNQLLIVNEEYFIKIYFTRQKDFNIRITDIFINNNKVIKYSDIDFPFKYVIPTNCFYLIYKDNHTYNVDFFIKSSKDSKESLLGNNCLVSGYYNFKINPNTHFYLNKMSKDEYENWINLCSDYQVNKFNILYLNKINKDPDETGYCFNEVTYKLMNFNYNEIIKNKLNQEEYNDITFLQNKPEDNFINITNNKDDMKIYIETEKKEINNKYIESLKNFFNKISQCVINCEDNLEEKYRDKLCFLSEKLLSEIHTFVEQISNSSISDLLNNYHVLYNYLLSIKIYNFICIIIQKIDNKKFDDICPLIKINNEYFKIKKKMFKYKFEVIFELIFGSELVNEQLERYEQIIESFIKYSKEINKSSIEEYILKDKEKAETINILDINQIGGKHYPLHHFMMGKGKSAVITPLLALYFSIIHNKTVYIIIPPHLKSQTEKLMNNYIQLFNIKDNIKIFTDSDIKYKFLDGEFTNNGDNKNKIMLIDEFDSIINPIKSNYNLIAEKNIPINNLLDIIKKYITKSTYECIIKHPIPFNLIDFITTRLASDDINKFIYNDIDNILMQISTNKLTENINWGIHPEYAYAIPFKNKDKPLLQSNFSSIVLTIVLTIYYYIILENDNKINIIFDYIKNNKLSSELLSIEEDILTIDIVRKKLKDDNTFIYKTIDKIFSNVILPEYQYNTSFIDIINIDNIFKIGYSGTVNIDLPNINEKEQFIKKNVITDYDEEINIKYAIEKAEVQNIYFDNLSNEEKILYRIQDIIKEHNAIIDIYGLFKNTVNKEMAYKLYELFEKKCEIIFIDDHTDNIKVIKNDNIEDYSESTNYINPFIYYSQAHTVGVDIKQDNYPNLKGLCIIDKNSLYTDVAQGIFRLRKINLGHTVSFLCINLKDDINPNDEINKGNIFKKLQDNDNNSRESKKKNFDYQVIKSKIRKIRKKRKYPKEYKFKEKYKELTKFYFKDYNIENPYDGIFTRKEINDNNFNNIFNEEDNLKLIYNYNLSNETNIDIQVLQNHNQDQIIVVNINTNEQTTKKEDIWFPHWDFVNRDEIVNIINKDNNLKDIKNVSINLEENVYFLPNIFSNINTVNDSEILFVYLPNLNIILIIPGYMVIYFYKKYIIFNTNINIINEVKIDNKYIKNTKEIIKNLSFIKILHKIPDYKIPYKNNAGGIIISCFLLYTNIALLSIEQREMYNKYKKNIEEYKTLYNNMIEHIKYEKVKLLSYKIEYKIMAPVSVPIAKEKIIEPLLWTTVLDNWKQGIIQEHFTNINEGFRWDTSVLEEGKVYKESFIKENTDFEQNNYIFETGFKKNNVLSSQDNKYVISIQNDDGSIFVIPKPSDNKNYSTLKYFTSNADKIEQQYFWKEVAVQAEKLMKKNKKVYISASSLDIYYTHVIISLSPNRYPID